MLNGSAPVLIFHFYNAIPGLGSISEKIGTPVPIYLSEKLFNTSWKSHDANISIISKTIGSGTFQSPFDSTVSVSLVFNRKSGVLAKLLPLLDLCYNGISKLNYNISYFNRDMLVFNSKLTDFRQHSDEQSDLSTITLTLYKESPAAQAADNLSEVVKKAGVVTLGEGVL